MRLIEGLTRLTQAHSRIFKAIWETLENSLPRKHRKINKEKDLKNNKLSKIRSSLVFVDQNAHPRLAQFLSGVLGEFLGGQTVCQNLWFQDFLTRAPLNYDTVLSGQNVSETDSFRQEYEHGYRLSRQKSDIHDNRTYARSVHYSNFCNFQISHWLT